MKKIFLVALCLFCLCPAAFAAVKANDQRTISVRAKSTVKAKPDKATARFSIVSRAKTAIEARKDNAERAKKVLRAVKSLKIDEKRIKLELLRINEQREYDSKKRKSVFKGFEAVRTFTVEVHELSKLPALVERIVNNGSNELQGVDYGLRDTSELQMKALEKAAKKAEAKAAKLAAALKTKTGKALTITEDFTDYPRPFMTRRLAAMDFASAEASAGEPEAFAAGEIEVSSSITAVFELL